MATHFRSEQGLPSDDTFALLEDGAGAVWVADDANYYYHGSLANALSGADINPGSPEIQANFNPNLGTPTCLAGSGWYLGLDGKTPTRVIVVPNRSVNVVV